MTKAFLIHGWKKKGVLRYRNKYDVPRTIEMIDLVIIDVYKAGLERITHHLSFLETISSKEPTRPRRIIRKIIAIFSFECDNIKK